MPCTTVDVERESLSKDELLPRLSDAMRRAGFGEATGLHRLTGGATMESWRFACGDEDFVLRRAPSLDFMKDRPFGHDTEAAIIRAAHSAGVTAPEVVCELAADDGIGSGFVMRALPGTPDPREILAMDDPEGLLAEAAGDLARIHSLEPAALPSNIPTLDYREGIAGLRQQFEEAGGDRPIIALGLKWLMDNCPDPVTPLLNHGDYRMGNLLAEDGHLTGVLDWELAHFGDPHEDLAFGCMTVWRFARIDRPALGLGSLEDYFAAYQAAGGCAVDPDRFRFWLIYRTVWWALGCLQMAKYWRSGEDRMLERVVISRRASEQELDLLMLLEEEAPEEELTPEVQSLAPYDDIGEAREGELAEAVSEWLETIKPLMTGHDRFQLAVARNALGIIARRDLYLPQIMEDEKMTKAILAGGGDISHPRLLGTLRQMVFEKVSVDSPKYPALAVARKKWLGDK